MNGIIVVNKPSGYTSRDIVNIVGKSINTKKVGHTGTLDPMAEGVLVICVNDATKLVELLTDHEKDYIAEVKLGIKTDTLDITGTVLEEQTVVLEEKILKETLLNFNKTYQQEVPEYSAVKINGKKMYEYKRAGLEIPNKIYREVTVSNMELLAFDGDTFKFKCHVSKGTYIRQLISDICNELGVIGTMSSLVRTSLGNFSLKDANSIEDIKANHIKMISINEVLSNYKTIDVDAALYKKIANGVIYEENIDDLYIYFTYQNKPLALYKKHNDNKYHMDKYFK